jgi:hypothetical protein
MHAFRRAVESKDFEAGVALLADDVVFQSPVVFKPYVGRDVVGLLLRTVATVFEDFHYVAELSDGPQTALVFRARVGDRQVEGIDQIRVDAEGRITHLTVFVRPLSGLLALAEAMKAKLGA